MERLQGFYEDKKAVDLNAAFAALTADIITYYSYGESFDFLDSEGFRSEVRNAIMETEKFGHTTCLFLFVLIIIRRSPQWFCHLVQPSTAVVALIQERVAEASSKAIRNAEYRTVNGKPELTTFGRFDALTDLKIPPGERMLSRIHDEGMILLSGGTEPTANALTVYAFHLISNRGIMAKLQAELLAEVMDGRRQLR